MSVEYWIWLQQVLGYSHESVSRVLANYDTAKQFYLAPDEEKIKVCRLNKTQIQSYPAYLPTTDYHILHR